MQFLTEDEARPIARRFKTPAEDARRKGRFVFDTGLESYNRIAAPLLQEMGPFAEAILWIDDIIFGDSFKDGKFEHPFWQDYYDWRRRNGDDRRLWDARVYVFDGSETALLAEALTYAVVLACDARLMARPGKTFLRLSHDDYIDVMSGANARKMLERMGKLGCKVLP